MAVGQFSVEIVEQGWMHSNHYQNQGCGRLNPDGSKGSCAACHTAHRFSIAEARKPENCGKCHLGPDHPQDEIYFSSKHGKRYLAEKHKWRFDAAPDAWEPGTDFSAPTCAVCHMSGVGPLATTHDVGERLKWEAQAPLTVPNSGGRDLTPANVAPLPEGWKDVKHLKGMPETPEEK